MSALLALCSNVGFGASTVAMNAYIPSLAKESPEVAALAEQLEHDTERSDSSIPADAEDSRGANSEDSSAPLLGRPDSTSDSHNGKLKAQHQELLSRATSRISSVGIATGYIAGICLLVVALVPVTKMKGSTFSLRLAIGLSGIWWAVFTLPAALWLPGGRPEKRGADRWLSDANAEQSKPWNVRQEISAAWVRLFKMLRYEEIKKLRNTFKFLAAWFLLSDGDSVFLVISPVHYANIALSTGFTTITSTALLFGKTTLHMSPSALILIGVLTPASGILGSLAWPYLQRKFNWSNLKVLLILITLASLIPLYGCLGFVTQGRFAFGGLTTQEEMFGLAVYFGPYHYTSSPLGSSYVTNSYQVQCTGRSKVIAARFMQSCYLQGKKRGGTVSFRLRTRFVLFYVRRMFFTDDLHLVEFLHRASCGRNHRRYDGKYSLLVFLPCPDGLGGHTPPYWCGCRAREEGCSPIRLRFSTSPQCY